MSISRHAREESATLGATPADHADLRRSQILAAAATLISAEGFHAVGLSDIGAAIGVSGPALYRYFPSKQHILVALFDEFVSRLPEGVVTALQATGSPMEALDHLVAFHTKVACDAGVLLRVYVQEECNLPPNDRIRLREGQRGYLEHWVALLRQARPELPRPEARLAIQATINLIHAVAHQYSGLERASIEALIESMARGALAAAISPDQEVPPAP